MVARISPETRDSAVQILDAFLAQLDATVISDPLKDNSAFFIGLAAAAAIILASKVWSHLYSLLLRFRTR